MSEQTQFVRQATLKSEDKSHFEKINKAIRTYHQAVEKGQSDVFKDWQAARRVAAQIKEQALLQLPELLIQFEANIKKQGAQVLWAKDGHEALGYVWNIFKENQAELAIKAKTMVAEEIHLNQFLQGQGIELWETDLGELIVQLAGERPYHIVTPAMHKSLKEISELFQKKIGIPPTESAETLTQAARHFLRDKFIRSAIGITGANFLIADAGAIVMTENEGNGSLCMTLPKTHIVLAGIEKIIPKLTDLSLFLPLLAVSGTGQQLTSYNSIVWGPKQVHEVDGPEKMYVILIDNGRSKLYRSERFRESLRCIRCGACLNACPVYRTVGGHTYGTTYQGPIGALITPFLRGMREWFHLPYASSLCGACRDVCPVQIDIHHLLLEHRKMAVEGNFSGIIWKAIMKLWVILMMRRAVLNFLRPVIFFLTHYGTFLLPSDIKKHIPKLSPMSFEGEWRKKS